MYCMWQCNTSGLSQPVLVTRLALHFFPQRTPRGPPGFLLPITPFLPYRSVFYGPFPPVASFYSDRAVCVIPRDYSPSGSLPRACGCIGQGKRSGLSALFPIPLSPPHTPTLWGHFLKGPPHGPKCYQCLW